MSLGSIGENSYFSDSLENFQSIFYSLESEDKSNNIDSNDNNYIDEESAEREYVTQSHLYLNAMKSITQLKQRLIRRTSIISEIRKYYLRDIVTVKELIHQVLTTEERKAFVSLYDQNLPSLDMTQCLLLHGPNKCEMIIKHCEECGGHVEIVMRDSIEVEKLKKTIEDCKARESRFRIKLAELDTQIEIIMRDKSESMKKHTEEKKYLYNEMKKLRSQHDELQEEMSNLSKVHKKSQAENIGYKAKLNSLIHASELLEQADLAKELLKAEIAEANNTIKQMKINQKSTQKEVNTKNSQIQELQQSLDTSKEENRVLKNDKETLSTQILKIKTTNKDLNSQLIDLNMAQSISTNRIKILEESLEKISSTGKKQKRKPVIKSMVSNQPVTVIESIVDVVELTIAKKKKNEKSILKVDIAKDITDQEVSAKENQQKASFGKTIEEAIHSEDVPVIQIVPTSEGKEEIIPEVLGSPQPKDDKSSSVSQEKVESEDILQPISHQAIVNAEQETIQSSSTTIETEEILMVPVITTATATEVIDSIKEDSNILPIELKEKEFGDEKLDETPRKLLNNLQELDLLSTDDIIEGIQEPVHENFLLEDKIDHQSLDHEADVELEEVEDDDEEEDEEEDFLPEDELERKEILKIAAEIYEQRKNAIHMNEEDILVADTTQESQPSAGIHQVSQPSVGIHQESQTIPMPSSNLVSVDQASQCELISMNNTASLESNTSEDIIQPTQNNHQETKDKPLSITTSELHENETISELVASPSASMIKRRKSLPRTMSLRQLTLKNIDTDTETIDESALSSGENTALSKEEKLLLRLEQLKKEFDQGMYRPAVVIKNEDGSTTSMQSYVHIPVPVIPIEKHVKTIYKPKPKINVDEVPVPIEVVPVPVPVSDVIPVPTPVVPVKPPRKTIITDPVIPLDDIAEDASEYEILLRESMQQALIEYPNIKQFEINKYLNAINKPLHYFCSLFDKSLDATWSSLLSSRSNLDSLARMNFILEGMITCVDPKIDGEKFDSLYKKIIPYTDSKIDAKLTSSWKDEVRISDDMIFELNPRIDEFTGKSILKRYDEYYQGSLKSELTSKVSNALDTIKKMSKYTDRVTNKIIKNIPEMIQDWQKVKRESYGLNMKIANEVDLVRKALEAKVQTYQRELESVGRDSEQHLLEIETLNARVKELLIKEIDLNSAKVTIEAKNADIEDKVKQIAELYNSLENYRKIEIEKDGKISELENHLVNSENQIIKINQNLQDNATEIQNLKNSLSELTIQKDRYKSEHDAMVLKDNTRLHGLVSSYMQVEPYVCDQSIQTEFVAPPMNLRSMIAGKHSNVNARGKQRSTQVFSQSLDASHSVNSLLLQGGQGAGNTLGDYDSSIFGDNPSLMLEGSTYHSIGTERTRKLGVGSNKVIHLQQASTPLTPLIFKHTANTIAPPQQTKPDSIVSKNNNFSFSNSIASSGSAVTIADGLIGNSLNKSRTNFQPYNSVYSVDSNYGDFNDSATFASSNQLKVGFADDNIPQNNTNYNMSQLSNKSINRNVRNQHHNPASSGSFQHVHYEQKVPQQYVIDQHSSNLFPLATNNNNNNNQSGMYQLDNHSDSSSSTHHHHVGLPEVKVLSYAQQIKQQQQQNYQNTESFNLDSPRSNLVNITTLNKHQLEKDNTMLLSKSSSLQPGYDIIDGIVYNNKGFNDPLAAANNHRTSSPNSTSNSSTGSAAYLGPGIHIDGSVLNNTPVKLHYRNNDNYMLNNDSSTKSNNNRVINALNVIDPHHPVLGSLSLGVTEKTLNHSSNNKKVTADKNSNISDDMLRRLRKELVSR